MEEKRTMRAIYGSEWEVIENALEEVRNEEGRFDVKIPLTEYIVLRVSGDMEIDVVPRHEHNPPYAKSRDVYSFRCEVEYYDTLSDEYLTAYIEDEDEDRIQNFLTYTD